jgi:Holliday junction resolvase RusA-like endonuclease
VIRFEVQGQPAPQGSKRHVGNGRMVEQSKAVIPWRQDVKAAAQAAMGWGQQPPLQGPVALAVTFALPKPASAPKRKRTWPARRPDLDKLLRSTLDALTGVVFADDGQVVSVQAAKAYVNEGTHLVTPGAVLMIWEVTDDA